MSSDASTPTVHTAEDIMNSTAPIKVGDVIHIGNVRSEFGGQVTFGANDDFANVRWGCNDKHQLVEQACLRSSPDLEPIGCAN